MPRHWNLCRRMCFPTLPGSVAAGATGWWGSCPLAVTAAGRGGCCRLVSVRVAVVGPIAVACTAECPAGRGHGGAEWLGGVLPPLSSRAHDRNSRGVSERQRPPGRSGLASWHALSCRAACDSCSPLWCGSGSGTSSRRTRPCSHYSRSLLVKAGGLAGRPWGLAPGPPLAHPVLPHCMRVLPPCVPSPAPCVRCLLVLALGRSRRQLGLARHVAVHVLSCVPGSRRTLPACGFALPACGPVPPCVRPLAFRLAAHVRIVSFRDVPPCVRAPPPCVRPCPPCVRPSPPACDLRLPACGLLLPACGLRLRPPSLSPTPCSLFLSP